MPGPASQERYAALAKDLDALRARLEPLRGPSDLRQLRALQVGCTLAVICGLGLSAWGYNPLSPLLLALAASTRWMVLGHHVCHGALDPLPQTPEHWRSHSYARGWKRWLYWPDWIEPTAWSREHNQLHHAYTNDPADPDVPQRQAQWLRASGLPLPLRYVVVLILALNWRWAYYAPSTAACAVDTRLRLASASLVDRARHQRLWSPWTPAGRLLWLRSWLPYLLFTFAFLPLLTVPLGHGVWQVALVHLAIAEALCSLHTFMVIVPNHAGDDLWLFEGRAKGKAEWYARQILGSCNYRTGGFLNDLLHGWLNYQIEHHLWPDLTPRQYAAAAPEVRALCARHGVPYVQQSIWRRLGKLMQILVGSAEQPMTPAHLKVQGSA